MLCFRCWCSRNAAKPDGADAANRALDKHDGGVLDNLDNFLDAPDVDDGNGILRHLLGNRRALFIIGVALVGCESRRSGKQPDLGDSAGVVIVESFSPRWETESGWTLASEPDWTVANSAATHSDPEDILFVSIRDVEVLSDGRVAVADQVTAQVFVFDSLGGIVHRLGGSGDGPGELRGIWNLFVCAGDTILVGFRRQLDVFDSEGSFVRRFTTTDGQNLVNVRGV